MNTLIGRNNDADPLWRNLYTAHWPRKSKWPEIYFKMKGIPQEQEQWRVYYLQRQLQETLNISGTTNSYSVGIYSVDNISIEACRIVELLKLVEFHFKNSDLMKTNSYGDKI